MHVQRIDTGRGWLFRIEGTSAHLPSELYEAPETAAPTRSLENALAQFLASVSTNASVYQPDALPGANGRVAVSAMSAVKNAASVYREEARRYVQADARAHEPAPLTDAVWEAGERHRIASLDLPQRIGAVQKLTLAQSSALIRHGDLDRMALPSEIATAVRRRHAILAHLDRTGMRANFATRATLDNPLATGVNEDAAIAAADAVLKQHEQRGERVQMAANAIRGATALIAAATGKTAETVWAELAA